MHRTDARRGYNVGGDRLGEHQETGFKVDFVICDGGVDADLNSGDLILASGIKRRHGAGEVAEDPFLHASRDGLLHDLLAGQPCVT